MLAEPLTHSQMIQIAAKYAERGHVLDMGASSRADRRLTFKPRIHNDYSIASGFSIKECLCLENPWRGTYRLLRELVLPNGLVSRLVISGSEPVELLDTADAIPLERGFHFGERFILAKSYSHEPLDWGSRRDSRKGVLTFTSATAKVAGLTLLFDMPQVHGYPAKIRITSSSREPIDLPVDLLAVLGHDWRTMATGEGGWTTTMRVNGREPNRSAKAEANVEHAVGHVAQILIEPPQQYHEDRARSRWWVQIRDCVPLVFWGSVVLALVQLWFLSMSWFALSVAASPFILFVLIGLPFLEWSKLSRPQRPRPVIARTWWHSA